MTTIQPRFAADPLHSAESRQHIADGFEGLETKANLLGSVSAQHREHTSLLNKLPLGRANTHRKVIAAMNADARAGKMLFAARNDIVFQINLLALNAGIEAARASVSGHGFSVVTAEMRQFGSKADEAAKEKDDVTAARGLLANEAESIRQSTARLDTGNFEYSINSKGPLIIEHSLSEEKNVRQI